MVSPSPNWTETEDGYQIDDLSLTVHSVSTSWQEEEKHRKMDAYEVAAYYGYHSHQQVATFADALRAWRFTNLLTWYLDETSDNMSDSIEFELRCLVTGDGSVSGDEQWFPPAVIEEMEALKVLEKMDGNLLRAGPTIEEIHTTAERQEV